MKKWILASVLSAFSVASATAADIYQPGPAGYKDEPYFASPWTGWYTGFNAGYAFSKNSIDYYFNDPAAGTTSTTYRFDKSSPSGIFAGTQGGYNWQTGRVVYGIEFDTQVGDISDTRSKLNPANTLDTYGYKTQLDWFSTLRGRLGYTFGPALLYATGGVALGQIESQVTYTSTFPQLCCGAPPGTVAFGRNNKTETNVGYVVGGGLEYAVTPKWSIKGEYQFMDLGKTDVGTIYCYSGCTTNQLHAKVDNSFNIVTVGLNYHIGSVYTPLK